jgi:hypothetical protein
MLGARLGEFLLGGGRRLHTLPVGIPLAGWQVTTRVKEHLVRVITDGQLWKTLPHAWRHDFASKADGSSRGLLSVSHFAVSGKRRDDGSAGPSGRHAGCKCTGCGICTPEVWAARRLRWSGRSS